MSKISVVIITRNEARNIIDCILSARKISDDVIIVDSGSVDETAALAKQAGARICNINWPGYGNARNVGAALAKNDWILSLDADERITDDLVNAISAVDLSQKDILYGFMRINFFGNTIVKHGTLRHDRVYRLYHRQRSYWNAAPVHEKLIGDNIKRQTLRSHVMHYGIQNAEHYYQKKTTYAFLCALKYKEEKRRFIAALRFLSPVYNFIQSYIFQLGFLDKRMGFTIAKINAYYTSKKYRHLYAMMQEERSRNTQQGVLRSSLKWLSSLLS